MMDPGYDYALGYGDGQARCERHHPNILKAGEARAFRECEDTHAKLITDCHPPFCLSRRLAAYEDGFKVGEWMGRKQGKRRGVLLTLGAVVGLVGVAWAMRRAS